MGEAQRPQDLAYSFLFPVVCYTHTNTNHFFPCLFGQAAGGKIKQQIWGLFCFNFQIPAGRSELFVPPDGIQGRGKTPQAISQQHLLHILQTSPDFPSSEVYLVGWLPWRHLPAKAEVEQVRAVHSSPFLSLTARRTLNLRPQSYIQG